MNITHIQHRRRLFVKIVTGCAVLSYPAFVLWGRREMLLTPIDFLYQLGMWYVNFWFLKPVGFAAWFAGHGLYVLACRWWLRCGSLQSWLFALLFGISISVFGAMAIHLAMRFPKQLGMLF